MAGEVGTSNGDSANGTVQCFKSEVVNNGVVNDGSEGSSGASEGLRTYKRRKRIRSSWESKRLEDGRVFVEDASKPEDRTLKDPWAHSLGNHTLNGPTDVSCRQWRKFVLEHMYQSLSCEEGGIRGCIRDALMMTESDSCEERRCRSSLQVGCTLNGTGYAAKQHMGVICNGAMNASHHTVTEMCQRAFLRVLLSERFTLLCKLLFENFQGIKADNLFSLRLINRRMKEGVYEHSPMLFHEDVDKFWRKLLGFGSELISLAKSLLDMSRFFYNKQVGGSVHWTVEDGNPEFCTQESNSNGKPEQTEACCVYRVCTCSHCGNNADGRTCLICDSCEEMYHISCIEPAVKEIPPKSWYCAHCTANGMRSLHENCVVCERMNAFKTLHNEAGCEIGTTNEETFNEFVEIPNYGVDDGVKILGGRKNGKYFCKFCGCMVQNGEKVKICDHSLCPNKYYHVRCLSFKQLKSYGPHWYCPSCLCRACLTDRDDDKIVLCDGCDHAYHLYCMIPPRTSIPRGKWFCRQCDVKIQEIWRVKRAYEQYANQLNKKGEGAKLANEKQPTEQYEGVKRAYKKYVNRLKEVGDRVKSAYASQSKGTGESVKTAYENPKRLGDGGGESDKGREGMEILLSAALEF